MDLQSGRLETLDTEGPESLPFPSEGQGDQCSGGPGARAAGHRTLGCQHLPGGWSWAWQWQPGQITGEGKIFVTA